MFQIKRPRIPRFAKWAKINVPFTKPKHYIASDGKSIVYSVKENIEYSNHIEMSSFYVSGIISYGADKNGKLRLMRHIIFPTLRCYPNNTSGSLDHNFKGIDISIDGVKSVERVKDFIFDGSLSILSKIDKLKIERKILPAQSEKCFIEKITLTNNSQNDYFVKLINNDKKITTPARYGNMRERYNVFTYISNDCVTLKPNESAVINVAYCALRLDEQFNLNFKNEQACREDFVKKLDDTLIIKTPNEHINLMARYAKIRGCESIFKTKSGLMHSPGGGNYYAALWTNDQCEYINPLFGYLGYEIGEQESINCYEMYRKYVYDDKALITSIVAEGDDIWHGAKDRGDSAMYAYGLARFLLTYGDKQLAENFVELIDKCLAYTLSQTNSDGVISSDSDELENRLESGKTNLCTSTLAFDALISASYLHLELGNAEKANFYKEKAATLKSNILSYFSKNVEGYATFMYCLEEPKLRSWICMPMVVGIFERSKATKDALLSPKLRMAEGLLSASGDKTFWDRSTLYTLRGLFNAGYSTEALELLEKFSTARLLGEHIPYAVEAFPEGNQAQLSAESGLYLRIFTEGILGMRPTGFGKFTVTPNLPKTWDCMECNKLKIAGKIIDIKVIRKKSGYELHITNNGITLDFEGKNFEIQL